MKPSILELLESAAIVRQQGKGWEISAFGLLLICLVALVVFLKAPHITIPTTTAATLVKLIKDLLK